MAFENVNSLLVADIGNVHTRLMLIDLVEGEYRMVASSRTRTTAEPPLASVSLGIERAAQEITDRIGRQLISPEADNTFIVPETDGHGVDSFLATTSAGRPMRVFLVGLTPEISLASGRHMLAGSYVTITDTLSPDDLRSQEEKINAILRDDPDLIVIVGGTDDGAEDILLPMVETIKLALSLIRYGTMPAILFAGNKALKKRVMQILSPVTTVFHARNVRPRLHDEQVFPAQIELALVYDDFRSKGPGGFGEVSRQSQVGAVPTTQGYISTIRYMCALPQRGIGPLCVDIGSANSLIVAGVNKEPHFSIRTDAGIGHNLPGALEAVTPESVMRWLPFDVTADDLWDYAYNKQLHPATIPATTEELMIEQAVAREVIRLMVAEARPDWGLAQSELLPPFQPVIGAGAILTDAPHPGISAMLLLDALQPTGIVELALDPYNMLAGMGVTAYLKPLITVQALDNSGTVKLCTAFCPTGSVRYGQDAMYVQIRLAGGKTITHAIKGGEIWMAPVLPGEAAEVSIKLRRGVSIDGKRRIKKMRLVAGTAGIVFDARGRPLVMPRVKDRAARLMRWQLAMTGREAGPSDADLPVPSLDNVYPETPELDNEEPVHAVLS